MTTSTVGICIAGEGAMGETHAKVLAAMPGVRLTAAAVGHPVQGAAFAAKYGIPFHSTSLADCVARPDVDAVVLATPSGLHTEHALSVIGKGKPVLLEIPAALSLPDTLRLAAAQEASGVPLMVCHSRRFGAPHRMIRDRIRDGSFRLHHMVVETYFLRRTNLNMFGQPRTWVDSLLWHHACHSVDLAVWLLDEPDFIVQAQQGPDHPELGVPMDMSIVMRSPRTGVLFTMAMSFNNKGPFGGFYRYIGEEDTYRVWRDELRASDDQLIALDAEPAFDRQDRAFIDAVRNQSTPESDIHSVIPSMRLLDAIERSIVENQAVR
jgi:2-hydroxy-4-carboxymuconate semialdehyde hemiacetal dehydrogenase